MSKKQFDFQSYMLDHQKQHETISNLFIEISGNNKWHERWLYLLSAGVIVALSVATGIAYWG